MLLNMPKTMGEKYSPLYFLASLGAGGLAVTFFMYLMFWVPHPGRPVPVFGDITTAFAADTPALQASILIAWGGIATMAFFNIRSLIWNIAALRSFAQTDAYQDLRNSNGETTLLAAPLGEQVLLRAAYALEQAAGS